MALTASNVLYGSFDLELLLAGSPDVSKFARTGLVEDAVASFAGETFEGETKVGDGTKVYWEEGRELIIEVAFQELDPTATTGDLAKIEDADKITLAFSDPSKTITVTGLESVRASVDGMKTKIVCKKSVATTSEWSDIFTIA